ncbi:hypothetical protein QE152_g19962 [Popillia japonica]|uniref:Uncharacterized protein n=1 Tax=Popillia japonica TaxID=7064 RepID=A0AAW1KP40_POPJA
MFSSFPNILYKINITKEIKTINTNITGLQQKYDALVKRTINLERKTRKNNIVVFGIQHENEENLMHNVLHSINNLLETNIAERDLNNVYRIGKRNTVIVEFISYIKKLELFKNIKKLKGSNIAIAHDLCPEDLRKRKQLYECYKKAKNNGLNAQIKHNSLYINGKCISITEEQDIVCSDGGDSDVFRKESMHDDRVVGDYTCTKLDGAEASIDAEREPRTGKHTGLSQAEEDSLTLGLRTGKRYK